MTCRRFTMMSKFRTRLKILLFIGNNHLGKWTKFWCWKTRWKSKTTSKRCTWITWRNVVNCRCYWGTSNWLAMWKDKWQNFSSTDLRFNTCLTFCATLGRLTSWRILSSLPSAWSFQFWVSTATCRRLQWSWIVRVRNSWTFVVEALAFQFQCQNFLLRWNLALNCWCSTIKRKWSAAKLTTPCCSSNKRWLKIPCEFSVRTFQASTSIESSLQTKRRTFPDIRQRTQFNWIQETTKTFNARRCWSFGLIGRNGGGVEGKTSNKMFAKSSVVISEKIKPNCFRIVTMFLLLLITIMSKQRRRLRKTDACEPPPRKALEESLVT